MIPIAADHAAVKLKAALQKALPDYDWNDLGPMTEDRVDYPDFAEKAAKLVASGQAKQAILLCGSGIGMCIAANKIPGIRAAVVESVQAAKLSREHNDANVLCLGARLLDEKLAIEITKTFLTTSFEGGRHAGRIAKISALEKGLKK